MLKTKPDSIEKIIAWENGTLNERDTLRLFQALVASGQAWTLQGMYGRTAQALLDAGRIKLPKPRTIKRDGTHQTRS